MSRPEKLVVAGAVLVVAIIGFLLAMTFRAVS